MTALKKYLSIYAEAECRQLEGFSAQYQQGLVIPVYREATAVLLRFIHFAEQQRHTLIILVLNRPESDSDTAWAAPFFNHNPGWQWQSENKQLSLLQLANNSGLLLIDRCQQHPAIPDKQGVGLARKIGADVLCALINTNCVESPWIFNSDADAHLPVDYFSVASQQPGAAALIYPFTHSYDDKSLNPLPTLLYEFSLHYYIAGLRWAGSSYAFQTLGSTLVIHYGAYAKVRGFPKRSAAEDFYLLNKVAKTGSIVSLDKPVIKLEARESSRVPFGTGPAVIALAALDDPLSMPLYHPDSFHYLKTFLAQLENYALTGTSLPASDPGIDTGLLDTVTAATGLDDALAHAFRQGKTPAARRQHLQQWFDGFKTLKFIHQLRDKQLASISFATLRAQATDNHHTQFFTPRMRELLSEIAQHS